jgi:hypothetical protein
MMLDGCCSRPVPAGWVQLYTYWLLDKQIITLENVTGQLNNIQSFKPVLAC